MSDHLVPGDASWRDDTALIANLTRLNSSLARYIVRYLDVDARRAEPITADDEHALGEQLAELGERLRHRAAMRRTQRNCHGPIVEGATGEAATLEPRRKPDMGHGP